MNFRAFFISLVAANLSVEGLTGQPAAAVRAAHPPRRDLPAAVAVWAVLAAAHHSHSSVASEVLMSENPPLPATDGVDDRQ
jgi:hypothetical protein